MRITYRREFRTFYLVSETQTQGQIVVLDAGVRETVVRTLGKLEPATLAQHGATLIASLADSVPSVREAVVKTLEKLELATLATIGCSSQPVQG